ncbi:uncharacterized protein TNCV_2705411 [Trichonephila clavipes]|nr:uncharacterized protein TNCV_2705411 [Trichonephila clavipes]
MQSHSFLCYLSLWQQVLCEVNDAQNYLQTEGLNIHQRAQKIRALQTELEAKREEFVDIALIYVKSLCEELEISFEPPRRSGGSIYLATECRFISHPLSHDGSVFLGSLEKRRFVKDRVEAIKDGHVEGGAVVIVRQRANPPLEDFILSYCFISEDLPPEWIEYGFYSKRTGRNPVFYDRLMFTRVLTPGWI